MTAAVAAQRQGSNEEPWCFETQRGVHPWKPTERFNIQPFSYCCLHQWIGLRENLQEKPYLIRKSMVSCKFSLKPIQSLQEWGPSSLAKLVNITIITIGYTQITIFRWGYKPTYNWGAPSCREWEKDPSELLIILNNHPINPGSLLLFTKHQQSIDIWRVPTLTSLRPWGVSNFETGTSGNLRMLGATWSNMSSVQNPMGVNSPWKSNEPDYKYIYL